MNPVIYLLHKETVNKCNCLTIRDVDKIIFWLFVTIPEMMNMMPAVRLILALVVSAMLFIVRQVREKTDITAPMMPSTTPTIIRARTAWKAPGGQETHTDMLY